MGPHICAKHRGTLYHFDTTNLALFFFWDSIFWHFFCVTFQELLAGPQIDLLQSTDMFLADGKLVVEQPLQLLVWDTKSSGQLELLRPTPAIVYGQEMKAALML